MQIKNSLFKRTSGRRPPPHFSPPPPISPPVPPSPGGSHPSPWCPAAPPWPRRAGVAMATARHFRHGHGARGTAGRWWWEDSGFSHPPLHSRTPFNLKNAQMTTEIIIKCPAFGRFYWERRGVEGNEAASEEGRPGPRSLPAPQQQEGGWDGGFFFSFCISTVSVGMGSHQPDNSPASA